MFLGNVMRNLFILTIRRISYLSHVVVEVTNTMNDGFASAVPSPVPAVSQCLSTTVVLSSK